MMRILFLILLAFSTHASDVMPLFVASNQNTTVSIQNPIGLPATSHATFGRVENKKLKVSFLSTAIFVIGAEQASIHWLETNQEKLRAIGALGFITNVSDMSNIIALEKRFKLPLLPVNVDDLMHLVGEHHYPLVISEGALWQ